MYETLQLIFNRLLSAVQLVHYRYLYHDFNLSSRLTGLVGPRGVGKTTLLLQYIKNHQNEKHGMFYFSADHIYFRSNTLYEFIEELYLKQEIKIFFIDEVHKYSNWDQELKSLYDGFPDLYLVFSGSSSLDLLKGAYDLSRRAKMYHLSGLSFREYLNFYCEGDYPACTFECLVSKAESLNNDISQIPGVLGHYHNYLERGYYPFYSEDPLGFYQKLLAMIDKTIYEDIANFYSLKTINLQQLGKILNYLGSTPPGSVSTYNLGKNLGISDKTAATYLNILYETGLANIIYPAEGGNTGLRKVEKVFFDNTNIHYALVENLANTVEIGTIRELAFIQAARGAGLNVFHSKKGDYQISDYIFEVGGKNKTMKQIEGVHNAFVVKDDTLLASKRVIPLLFFGFLY